MSPLTLMFLRRSAAAGLAVLLIESVVAQTPSASPFMPPAAAAAAAPTTAAPIQYRGFSETSDGVKFRIVDAAKKTGTWVRLNERDATFDVTVKQSAADYATVVVEHQGRTLTLALPESKVASSGSAMQNIAPPPPVMTNVPPAVTQAVVVNPTPADEQRRLEAVASEVARRRALREQASQQVGQPQPQPQVQPQQQQPAQRAAPGQNSFPAAGQQRPQRK